MSNVTFGPAFPRDSCLKDEKFSKNIIIRVALLFASIIAIGIGVNFYFHASSLSHVLAWGGCGGALFVSTLISFVCLRRKNTDPLPETVIQIPNPVLQNTVQNPSGQTIDYLLHKAATSNAIVTIEQLLKDDTYKTHLNLKDKEGFTPLHYAIQKGNAEAIRCLIENGADTQVLFGESELPLLHFAVWCWQTSKTIQSMIDAGINKDCRDAKGRTALFWVGENKNEQERQKLIEYLVKTLSIDVNAQDLEGKTALHRAAEEYDLEMMILLNQQHGNLFLEDKEGWNPVFLYVLKGNKKKIKAYSATYESILNKNFYSSQIPQVFEEFKEFKEFKLDLRCKNSKGWTLLHFVAKEGLVDAIEPLADLGINYKEKNEEGKTAFHIAAVHGQIEVIEKFKALSTANKGIDIGISDSKGNNLLHLAAANGQTHVITKLIEIGLYKDLNANNSEGIKPVEVALKKGHIETAIRMLILEEFHYKTKAYYNLEEFHEEFLQFIEIIETGNDRFAFCLKSLDQMIMEGNYRGVELYIETTKLSDPQPHPLLTRKENPPLHLAAKYGKIEIIKLLLKCGAVLTGERAKDHNQREPIHYAIIAGQCDVIEYFIREKKVGCNAGNANANLISAKEQGTDSLIFFAVSEGHVNSLNTLIRLGANPNEIITVKQGLAESTGPLFLHALASEKYEQFFTLANSNCFKGKIFDHTLTLKSNGRILNIFHFYDLIKTPEIAVEKALSILSESLIDEILRKRVNEEEISSLEPVSFLTGGRSNIAPFILGLAVKKHEATILPSLPSLDSTSKQAILGALLVLWKSKFKDKFIALPPAQFISLYSVMNAEQKKMYSEFDKLKENVKASYKNLVAARKKYENFSGNLKEQVAEIKKYYEEAINLRRFIGQWLSPDAIEEAKKTFKDSASEMKIFQDFANEMITFQAELFKGEENSDKDKKEEKVNKNTDLVVFFYTLQKSAKEKNEIQEEAMEIFAFLDQFNNTSNRRGVSSFEAILGISAQRIAQLGLFEGMDAKLIGLSFELKELIESVKTYEEYFYESKEKELKGEKLTRDVIPNECGLKDINLWTTREREKIKAVLTWVEQLVKENKIEKKSYEDVENFIKELDNFSKATTFKELVGKQVTKECIIEKLNALKELDRKRRIAFLKIYASQDYFNSNPMESLSEFVFLNVLPKIDYPHITAPFLEKLKQVTKKKLPVFLIENKKEIDELNINQDKLKEFVEIKEDEDKRREKVLNWFNNQISNSDLYVQFFQMDKLTE